MLVSKRGKSGGSRPGSGRPASGKISKRVRISLSPNVWQFYEGMLETQFRNLIAQLLNDHANANKGERANLIS